MLDPAHQCSLFEEAVQVLLAPEGLVVQTFHRHLNGRSPILSRQPTKFDYTASSTMSKGCIGSSARGLPLCPVSCSTYCRPCHAQQDAERQPVVLQANMEVSEGQ